MLPATPLNAEWGMRRSIQGAKQHVLVVHVGNRVAAICTGFDQLVKLFPSFGSHNETLAGEFGGYEWVGFSAEAKGRVEYSVVEVPLDGYYFEPV